MNEFRLDHEYAGLSEQRDRSRSRVRLAVFVVASLHVVVLLVFLMVGCKRGGETPVSEQQGLPAFPEDVVTSAPPSTVESSNAMAWQAPGVPADTNPPAGGPVSAPQAQAPVLPVVPAGPMVEQGATPGTEYVVAPGDTFYSIGRKFGVGYKAIEAANPGVDPRRLRVGQKLVIPAAGSGTGGAASGASPSVAAPSQAETTYTVQSGDTLTKIARRFGVTVRALRAANNLSTDRIKVGQKLKIPAKGGSAPAPVESIPSATGDGAGAASQPVDVGGWGQPAPVPSGGVQQ